MTLIERCQAKLSAHEPEEWPVPITKADLRALLSLIAKPLEVQQPTSRADTLIGQSLTDGARAYAFLDAWKPIDP